MVNRSLDKLANLTERLHALSRSTDIAALSFDDPALAEACFSCDLIVNTSSVGLKPSDPSILSISCLSRDHLVYDTIYQPPMTPLLVAAENLGCKTANGLSMLIHQGTLAFQHWFPGTSPLAVMRDAMRPPE
jgi:shikimate dehydrogenase